MSGSGGRMCKQLHVDVHTKTFDPIDVNVSSSHATSSSFLYQNFFFRQNKKRKIFVKYKSVV